MFYSDENIKYIFNTLVDYTNDKYQKTIHDIREDLINQLLYVWKDYNDNSDTDKMNEICIEKCNKVIDDYFAEKYTKISELKEIGKKKAFIKNIDFIPEQQNINNNNNKISLIIEKSDGIKEINCILKKGIIGIERIVNIINDFYIGHFKMNLTVDNFVQIKPLYVKTDNSKKILKLGPLSNLLGFETEEFELTKMIGIYPVSENRNTRFVIKINEDSFEYDLYGYETLKSIEINKLVDDISNVEIDLGLPGYMINGEPFVKFTL